MRLVREDIPDKVRQERQHNQGVAIFFCLRRDKIGWAPVDLFINLEDLEKIPSYELPESLQKTLENSDYSTLDMFGTKVVHIYCEFSSEAHEIAMFCIQRGIRWRADHYYSDFYKVMATGTEEEKKKWFTKCKRDVLKELRRVLKINEMAVESQELKIKKLKEEIQKLKEEINDIKKTSFSPETIRMVYEKQWEMEHE